MTDNGDRIRTLLARRKASMSSAYRLFYDKPLELVRGQGVWLYDAGGRAYLDAYNNVPIVGHCHPHVVEAVSRQLGTLNTHTRYLNEGVVDCAERMLARFPAGLDRITFACSGTEAVELALRVARVHTDAQGVIVTSFAYHGNSASVAQISPEEPTPEGPAPQVETIPAPDAYRSPGPEGEALRDYHLAQLEAAIARLRQRGLRPAALVLDTVFSSEGIVRTPPGYLAGAAALIRAAGGLLIADEVQAGFGRLGQSFWGFQALGAEPDLVTIGKPMGNGYPVSAMITRAEVLASFSARGSYFNTFGGSHAACAAARAVLEVIDQERLQDNANETGAWLRRGLQRLAEQHALIGEIRGSGLYQGIELVEDRVSKVPAAAAARRIANGLRDRGVLIGVTGSLGNVLKLRPPLVFSRQNADTLLERLSDCLAAERDQNP